MDFRSLPENLDTYFEHLRDLPYVKRVSLKKGTPNGEGIIAIRTPAGDFPLTLEVKRSYLDRTMASALLASAARPRTSPLLVFARYVPRPTGEKLAAAGVNFVDRVGNVHLHLGGRYHTLLLGKHETRTAPEGKRTGP